jgi:hypothetical protein
MATGPKPMITSASGHIDKAIEAETGNTSDHDEVPLGIVLVCIAAVTACALLLIATNSSLVGDGSYYLLRAIQTGQPFQVSGRLGANLVREGPLLIALHHGITNTHVLTLMEGVGFVMFPALVWVIAIFLARGSRVRFALVAISCGLCFGTMIFFSVSELTLALPLVVLSSVILTQSTTWSGQRAVLAVVSTGLLFFSHESIVPCAVILAAMALFRIKARLGSRDTIVSVVVLGLSVAVFGGAVWTLVFWPNPNSGSFLNFPPSILLLSMGATCLAGWALLYRRIEHGEWLRWSLVALALLFTAAGVLSAIKAGPQDAYSARGFCVAVVTVVQVVFLIDWNRMRRVGEADRSLGISAAAARGAAGFLVALMIIPTVYALRWSTVIGSFRTTITQHAGVVPDADVPTNLAVSYLWPWTNTTLSVLLRSSINDAVVENTGTMNPFTVAEAEQQIPPSYRWDG